MTFDAQAFLEASVNESNDTKIIPVPQGEYQAFIETVEANTWQSKDGTKSGLKLDLQWVIEDQDVKTFLGRDVVKVKQSIMLDTDGQRLDMSKGKNVGLGRLREAVGLNIPGEPFSFNMLPGRFAKAAVSHRIGNDGEAYAEIKSVAKL